MFRKMKEKVKSKLRRGCIFVLKNYFRNVMGGYKIYKSLLGKYGNDTTIIAHGWPGMGDIFLLHEYLNYYLEKNNIQKYVIVIPGSAAFRTVELFGIENIEQISIEENSMLVKFKIFMSNGAKNLHILHHDPPASHVGIGGKIQGIHHTTTRDMLLGVCMGLKDTTLPPSSDAHFENDPEYIKKLFKSNRLVPGKTVILSPYSNSCAAAIPMQSWVGIAETLKELGFSVCTNGVGPNEPAIEGTKVVSVPLKYSKAFLEYSGYFISMRSGLCDVIGQSKCKKYIIYHGGNICGCNLESDYFNLIKIGLSSDAKEFSPYNSTVRIIVDEILADIAQYAPYSEKKREIIEKTERINFGQDVSPAFTENNIAIAFSCSNEYIPYLIVAVQSIIDNARPGNNYDIVILEEDVTKENRELLKKTYSCANVSIRFINVAGYLSNYDLFTWGWYRPIMYGRFLVIDLMKQYEKVLYLDCDLVALHDVADLYNIRLDASECMAAARDVGMINTYCTPGCKEKAYFDQEIRIKNPLNYVNSGVLLFAIQTLRKEYTVDQIFRHFSSRKWMWQDQDALMTLFEGKIKYLDQSWNVMIQSMEGYPDLIGTYAPVSVRNAYIRAREEPKIIHYIENKQLKFNPVCDLYHYFWKYAKKTPYYELILLRAFRQNL
ncbi:glycosyltransferase family 8 protein [Pseudoflavonifractor sp. 524-17]|uniref:glycosyltransferase family 8 protein n=1 Tax=Pseudoflavonifractor sp. 524-17 TaxID=2304577 RepID=UPI00137AAC6E|nr:glycosyltransferase family 8 protein [Pseudoflavonifractor sp. 524-17]